MSFVDGRINKAKLWYEAILGSSKLIGQSWPVSLQLFRDSIVCFGDVTMVFTQSLVRWLITLLARNVIC
jgi:hypothetical protein